MRLPLNIMILKIRNAQKNLIRPQMARLGLTPGQPKVLEILSGQNGCIQKELAAAFDIKPATVSRLLDNMQEQGLLTRQRDENNGRATRIAITREGRRLHGEMSRLMAQAEEQALVGFTPREREQLFAFLERIYYNYTGREME